MRQVSLTQSFTHAIKLVFAAAPEYHHVVGITEP